MNCFENIVGVHACIDAPSTSGLWLNGPYGLPGINIDVASKVSDIETHTGGDLLKACIVNATDEIVLKANEQLSQYFQFNSIVDSYEYYMNTDSVVSGVQTFNLQLRQDCQKYTSYFIDSLFVKSSTTQSGVTVSINGVVSTFDMVADTVYELVVNQSYNADLQIIIDGVDIYTSTTFFSGTIQQRCDDNLFWCQFKKEMAMPIKYYAGVKFAEEVLSTDRYNLANTLGIDTWRSNRDLWIIQYRSFLKGAIESIKTFVGRENCCCISCSSIKYTYQIP
jgi:hypothetical protein